MNQSSNYNKIVKNTVFLYLRMSVVMVVSLYTSRVVLHALGVVDYGLYNVVGGFVTTISFLNLALSSSTARFLTFHLGKKDITKLKQTFSASLLMHICLSVIILILLETIGLWFLSEKLNIPDSRITATLWVYQFIIITTIFSITQAPYNSILIAHENMKIYAYIGLAEALSILAIGLLISISPFDKLLFYAFGLMVEKIIIQFILRWYTNKKYKECNLVFTRDKNIYKEQIAFSCWEIIGSIAYIAQTQGVNIVLNLFFGPAINAARAISVQVQTACNNILSNFQTAAEPRIVKSYAENDIESMYDITFSMGKYSLLLMLLIVIPAANETEYILNIWLGKNSYPVETITFTKIILICILVQCLLQALLIAFRAIGRIRNGNIVGSIVMITIIPVLYFMFKQGAPSYFAFIVALIAYIISYFVYLYFSWYNERFNIKNILVQNIILVVFSTFMYLISYSITNLYPLCTLRFIGNIIISDTFIIALSWMLLFKNQEKVFVKTYLKKVTSIVQRNKDLK